MYSVNDSYFNNITTEAQAYILAWFWSRGSGRIQIHNRDSDILYLIRSELSYTGEITTYKNISSLNITLPSFHRHLHNVGCSIKKSTCSLFPIIPNELVRHFLRGIFDSYGYLMLSKGKYINLSITHNDSFITEIRKRLKKDLNLFTSYHYKSSFTSSTQLLVTSHNSSLILLSHLYLYSSYYLARKKTKYQPYCKSGV
jgi:hypothetical protein